MDRMRERKQDDEVKGNPRDGYLESPDDIRKLKRLADREEKLSRLADREDDLIDLADHKAELVVVAENTKWWSGTHKKVKTALAYLATLIAAVVGTMAILEKFRGK